MAIIRDMSLLVAPLVPREIFELSASSNWDTAQLGSALIKPYFQTSVMSGWTPWSSPYSGYPPISPISGAPPGMAYDPYNSTLAIFKQNSLA